MENKMKNKWYLTVGLTVVVLVVTYMVVIPIPGGGFFNFGDVVIVFAGLLVGSRGGAIAGAVGSALADIILGYAVYAPITFIAKGGEGFISGLAKGKKGLWYHLFPILAVLFMVMGYFVGETLVPSMGIGKAVTAVPANLIQAGGGYLGGKVLFELYNKVFPQK